MAAIDRGRVLAKVRALVFDVFGTVVDWRGSILKELEALGRAKGIAADWARFVDDWRGGYHPAMQLVRSGALPWTNIDGLHRRILDVILVQHGIAGLTEDEKRHLNLVWHRLDPWPDAVAGLVRLKPRYIVGTLSNGNVALLVDMAKHAGLPWDVVLSAELVRHYKPDPEAYQMAPSLLGLAPHEVMMVAAHASDLAAAATQGLRTAYVSRPLERGPGSRAEAVSSDDVDVVAGDFLELAARLGP
ncbi:MAG TPA: haloacid dehalogenase type II [Stellaceae bacterium]|nr:haloacid dehalogenase type II [Stellaceae bacterium]